MLLSVNKIREITDKIKGKVLGWSVSYMCGKLISLVEEASGVNKIWDNLVTLLDMTKTSNIMLWVGCLLSGLFYLLNWVTRIIAKKQNPSTNFRRIMKEHTAEEIQKVYDKTYAWGYNYCVHYSKDPKGWSPEALFIGEYDDTEYNFERETEGVPDYCRTAFETYCIENPKVAAIRRKEEDRERFAASHIKCNLNRDTPKVDVKLKKTSWVQLQYSWDYFRLVNVEDNSKIVGKPNEEKIRELLYRTFEKQGDEFFINSFCLHLIIETKKGIILSRISHTKENDYASTWAATIGEQIEEKDFYSVGNGDGQYHKDFVERWTKRALEEEFGINIDSDYEDVMDSKSLKVLSVDMEADIYNVALTCVIKLKMSFEEFQEKYSNSLDRLENFELKECTLEEIRKILLGYPENRAQYHPSTYLRLLMFHRYKKGTSETDKLFCKDNKKLNKQSN